MLDTPPQHVTLSVNGKHDAQKINAPATC